MHFTRRDFLRSAGALSTVSMATPLWLRAGAASALDLCESDTRALIIVQLAGGNDGTNTVIPMSGGFRSTYDTLRPVLGVAPADLAATSLGADPGAPGAQLALHPHMTAFKALHDSGNLATLQGVHYPQGDLSHFESERIWYFADPDRTGSASGWMGQSINSLCAGQPAAVPAVDISVSLTELFHGSTQVLTARNIESFFFTVIQSLGAAEQLEYRALFDGIYGSALSGPAGLRQTFAASALAGLDKGAAWSTIDQSLALNLNDMLDGTTNGGGGFGATGVPFFSGLARDLRLVYGILRGGPPGTPLGPKIFHVTIGGFDTHSFQGIHDPAKSEAAKRTDRFDDEYHAQLLYSVDQAIGAFWQDCVDAGLASQTCVMTFSEFSRRIEENNDGPNAGTDHGTAAPTFVIGPNAGQTAGPSLSGGLFGTAPDMDNLDEDGNYPFDGVNSIDFRTMYAEIMTRWLDLDVVETESILGGFAYSPLGFLSS